MDNMATHPTNLVLQAAASHPDSETLAETLGSLSPTVQELVASSKLSLEDVARELATDDGLGRRDYLVAILSCLQHLDPETAQTCPGSSPGADAARVICDFASKSIAPIVVPLEDEDEVDGYHPTAADVERDVARTTDRCRPLAEAGLAVIRRLGAAAATTTTGAQVLATAAAYADESQPWTTPATAHLAREILQTACPAASVPAASVPAATVRDVLEGYLRPLFSRSRPAAVTDAGRRAHFAEDPDSHATLDRETRAAKPWKYQDLRAVSVFTWLLTKADDQTIRQHWPLCTPVLLALLDDADVAVRSRALGLLRLFVAKAGPRVLADTGLGSVFEDAVLPLLALLPGLTPEPDSLRLLDPAYEALLALARAAGPRSRLLDKVLRRGVFAGMMYAKDHVQIVEVLARNAGVMVRELGIHAVKHLKDLIPMLTSIMEEPFAMAHPPSLMAAIDALQIVIECCWPRLAQAPWREAIVKALVVCWMGSVDDGGTDEKARGQVQARLARTSQMLSAVTRAQGGDLDALVAPLTAKDPSLRELFGTDSS